MILGYSLQNFGPVGSRQVLSFEAESDRDMESYFVEEMPDGTRILKLALVYGPNASGKSTLLEGLDLLLELILNPLEKKTDLLPYRPFLSVASFHHAPTEMSLEFYVDGIRYEYALAFTREAILWEELLVFNPKKALVYRRETDLEGQIAQMTIGSKVKLDKASEKSLIANTLWNTTVLGGFLKTNIQFPELKSVMNWFQRFWNPIIKPHADLSEFAIRKLDQDPNAKQGMLDLLAKADLGIVDVELRKEDVDIPPEFLSILESRIHGDPHIKDIWPELQRTGKMVKTDLQMWHNGDLQPFALPLKLESRGTQRYFGLSGVLAYLVEGNEFFAIDELEMSLHPDLFKHFLTTFLLNSKGSQLLATTHSREILGERDFLRNDVIWFTEKDQNGATQLFSLSDFQTDTIRKSTNVLNAYKTGKLGAIPQLRDNFMGS